MKFSYYLRYEMSQTDLAKVEKKSPLMDFVKKNFGQPSKTIFFFSFDINHFPRQKSQYVWSEIKTEQAKSLVCTYLSQTQPILHAQVHVCYYKNIPKSDWSTAKLSFRKNSQDKEKSDFHSHEQNSNEMMAHQFHSFNNWQKVLKKICTLKLVK